MKGRPLTIRPQSQGPSLLIVRNRPKAPKKTTWNLRPKDRDSRDRTQPTHRASTPTRVNKAAAGGIPTHQPAISTTAAEAGGTGTLEEAWDVGITECPGTAILEETT